MKRLRVNASIDCGSKNEVKNLKESILLEVENLDSQLIIRFLKLNACF